jgi:hypothetical protein
MVSISTKHKKLVLAPSFLMPSIRILSLFVYMQASIAGSTAITVSFLGGFRMPYFMTFSAMRLESGEY